MENPTAGIPSTRVVEVMGLGGTRGVGGAFISVKRVLRETVHFDFDEIIAKGGDPGNRRWKAGKRLKEALEKLEGGGL